MYVIHILEISISLFLQCFADNQATGQRIEFCRVEEVVDKVLFLYMNSTVSDRNSIKQTFRNLDARPTPMQVLCKGQWMHKQSTSFFINTD